MLGSPRWRSASLVRLRPNLRNALSRLHPSFPRDRIMILTRLALARVHLGELDGACRAANEAGGLLRQLDSQHQWTRLGEFRKAVQPYSATAQVKDFDAKFGDLVRSASV